MQVTLSGFVETYLITNNIAYYPKYESQNL